VDGAQAAWAVVILVGVVFLIISALSKRGGGRGQSFGVGPGAYGTIYDLLNQDKRNAIELIVEDRAAERDEEHADDIPPDEAH
jgi:hypothetical protein